MAISKIGSKALVDCSVASADLEDGSITNAKLANSSITVNGTSVSLGASASLKDISWQSVINASGGSNTAVAGEGYFIDTTSNTHTVTLPASPSIGDKIAIKDYAGTFGTNNLTIGRNGNNIQGVANDSLISTNRASLILVYSDATKGWLYTVESNVADLQFASFITATGGTVTESGDFKIHTFTGDGCFAVSQIGNPVGGPSNVDYLVVAGGGAGGGAYGGGGGAGGYLTSFPSPTGNLTVTTQSYPITVGAGASGSNTEGSQGSPSTFSTITATGGGGGGRYNGPVYSGAGGPGGSGGGGSDGDPGGSGNTPPTSPSQGNSGGGSGTSPRFGSGGGGGAGATGSSGTPSAGGNGAAGSSNSITGSSVTYAGGGGGGTYTGGTVGTGGSGGGGDAGASNTANPGQAGTANTGGGGGGASAYAPFVYTGNGGAGGKGIVIIRYKFQ